MFLPFGQDFRDDFAFVHVDFFMSDDLIILVALAAED